MKNPLKGLLSNPHQRAAAIEQLYVADGLFDNPFSAILVSNDAGVILNANPALLDLLGYSLNELRALGWEQLTHSDDLAVDREALSRCIRRQTFGYVVTKRYWHRDQFWQPVKIAVVRKSPPVRTNGTESYFVVFVKPIEDFDEAELLREMTTEGDFARETVAA